MNKVAKVFGAIATILLVLALFFKMSRWPGAGLGIIGASFFFCLFYLPIKLLADWRIAEFRLDKTHAIVYFFTAFLGYNGVMFKVMHWPGSALFMYLGLIVIPIYFFIYFRRRRKINRVLKSSAHDIYISISVFVVFFFMASGGGVSKIYLEQFISIEEQNLHLAEAYSAANNSMMESIENDSIIAPKERKSLELVHYSATTLLDYFTSWRGELVQRVENIGPEIADTLPSINFRRLDNFDIPSMYLLGDNWKEGRQGSWSGNELKSKIRTFTTSVDSVLREYEIVNSLFGIGLETDDYQLLDGETIPWESRYFGHKMFGTVLVQYARLRAMVSHSEYLALNALLDKFESKSSIDQNATQLEVFAALEQNKLRVEDLKNKQDLNARVVNDKQREIESAMTIIGFVFVAIFFVIILLILSVRAFVIKKKDNVKLEEQKIEISNQKILVEEKNHEIMDSINYAQRIQSAILPSAELISSRLKDSFVLYIPKDVVAGDFYWMEALEEETIFAAADCTGHGVPGALVSVVCHNALNRAVREFSLREPADILDKVRELVIETFEQSGQDVKDGMDISLCSLKGKKLSYAGAHNPLWIIRNGEILETKGNKQPIGKFDAATAFTNHEIELQSGDNFYLFTDGYVDQFGGDKGKKFKAKSFKALLLQIHDKSAPEQEKLIHKAFTDWKGSLEQVDDVCVIGVKV